MTRDELSAVRASERRTTAIVVVLCAAVLLIAWVTMSFLEAMSYQSVTGKSVSTWDAMFLDLRVQERPQ